MVAKLIQMQKFKLFVTGHKGFETLLFRELRTLLGDSEAILEKRYGGVEIAAGLDAIYRLVPAFEARQPCVL